MTARLCGGCLQSNPVSVSRGVSQPDRVSEEPSDLFSEEEEAASSTAAKANGVHSDDDNDLFAGEDTLPPNNICQFTRDSAASTASCSWLYHFSWRSCTDNIILQQQQTSMVTACFTQLKIMQTC